MEETFETFKPKSLLVKKYVDYYYLDIKPYNKSNEFQCFPHFNNTLSIYKSHIRLKNGTMEYQELAKPFQIFTPIREKILNVKQLGQVYRIVVVFYPFGIQQFYNNLNFSNYILDYQFFTQTELNSIFSTMNTEVILALLDNYLENRYKKYENEILEKSFDYIFKNYQNFSVTKLSNKINVSRQHLNRLYQTNFGVSIKKFNEIVLFRKTINQKLFENKEQNFTQLAHHFNFNDQSHFNKIYKNFTENSPKSFFKKGIVLGKEDTFWHIQ